MRKLRGCQFRARFVVATMICFLLQNVGHCGIVEAAAEIEESTQKSSRQLGLSPVNLGINIPYIFNMKLGTGPTNTGLSINVPAIFSMDLDTGGIHQVRPTGLRLNFFGAGRRGRGNSLRRRPSIFKPAEVDQTAEQKTAEKPQLSPVAESAAS